MVKKLKNNINITVENDLCLSCGICVGVCPRNCIKLIKDAVYGGVKPAIQSNKCISCGLCRKFCPGLSANYNEDNNYKEIKEQMIGKYISTYSGYAKDKKILENSASGGIVTVIIQELLKNNMYDCAVVVDNNKPNTKSVAVVCDEFNSVSKYQKSKYIMASYEKVISYIKNNRDKRIIIVSMGCIICSLKKYCEFINIKNEQNLYIGLFCDRTQSYSILEYFSHYDMLGIKKLKGLDYRTKSFGSLWPGNVNLMYNNSNVILPKEERSNVCEYFQNERCLYCLNHLNIEADISIGDNYTSNEMNKWGSNSIIVRTKKGEAVIEQVRDKVCLIESSIDGIIKSQGVMNKRIQSDYEYLKYKESGILINGKKNNIAKDNVILKEYEKRKKRIIIGRKYTRHPYIYNLYFILSGKSKIKNRLKIWRKNKVNKL